MEPMRFEDVLDAVHAVRERKRLLLKSRFHVCRGRPSAPPELRGGGGLRLEWPSRTTCSELVFLFARSE